MSNYMVVSKGPHKGRIGVPINDHTDKKMCYLSSADGAGEELIIAKKLLKPAGKDGDKLVIDQQVIRKVNEIKDLLIKKKRLDMPKPTDEEIKKLLACIETEE